MQRSRAGIVAGVGIGGTVALSRRYAKRFLAARARRAPSGVIPCGPGSFTLAPAAGKSIFADLHIADARGKEERREPAPRTWRECPRHFLIRARAAAGCFTRRARISGVWPRSSSLAVRSGFAGQQRLDRSRVARAGAAQQRRFARRCGRACSDMAPAASSFSAIAALPLVQASESGVAL